VIADVARFAEGPHDGDQQATAPAESAAVATTDEHERDEDFRNETEMEPLLDAAGRWSLPPARLSLRRTFGGWDTGPG
jgi:hypothetical protein